jgi:spore coat protein U-like protein
MRVALLAAPAALLLIEPASAQRRDQPFTVSVSVVADCQLNAQDLDFGIYDPAVDKSGQTLLTLRCTPGSRASLTFDGGTSGNPRRRHMQGPVELEYQLYRDAALQDPINTERPAFELNGRENAGQSVPYTVYGQVPAGQAVLPGDYIDTIRVTVEF